MSGLVAMALAIGPLTIPCTAASCPEKVTSAVDDPAVVLPATAAADRRHLADAIKKASRIGKKNQPSIADFDAATVGWGRQAAHLYVLPLQIEAAKLVDPPLDYHAIDKNLVLCVGGVHDMIQETLCEHLTGLVKRKVEPANVDQVLVNHVAGLSAKDRAEFVAKLVAAQVALRSAVRESALGMVSDETDCAKVIKRVGALGADPNNVVERIALANKEFKTAFEKSLKAASGSSQKNERRD